VPTLLQLRDWTISEIAKGKGECHTQHPVIMEEVRKEAIKNTAEKTRVGFETYSPRSYRAWNGQIETLMEELGCNPILVLDVMLLILKMAGPEGVSVAKENLCKLNDYENELREARAVKKRKRLRGANPKASSFSESLADA
jgi:hypothetical protein